MFQGLSIKSKKTSKNTQSKKANKGKTASLESTRSTSLSESFSERFDNFGVNDNTYERMLARIIENQGEILSKLKVIKDKVRRIKNCLNDLEQKMDNGFDITNDKAFKEDMIKGAAKALIEKAIYPKNFQIKSEAEKYIRENYAEYFKKFILKDWNVYYVNNIHRPLLQKIRSLRGTLMNKIKETLFSVYGNLIEPINNKANPDEVITWKKSTKTIECYQKLFEELEEAVCQTMLNPKNKIIMMSDQIVKKLIAINLNKLKYREHFSISSSDDEASQEDRDKSDDNDSENDNTEHKSKRKNNSNYSDKVNKRPRVKLVDLDLEEVQEAENDPDEDVDKEKDMDDYEKNTDNNE
ncbi:hypothetical protein F8M41_022025 [Gigaspora margarita]|uniref:Uncharacterized protein n=1 Tax=Gigaspora margarita TaxID=4874 RepID=A0A8H4AFS6_GIGMA|nr:hypothetical protein F8M41_022025 [Gigaspora margarita]